MSEKPLPPACPPLPTIAPQPITHTSLASAPATRKDGRQVGIAQLSDASPAEEADKEASSDPRNVAVGASLGLSLAGVFASAVAMLMLKIHSGWCRVEGEAAMARAGLAAPLLEPVGVAA